jgi:hypothetical protein
MNKYYQTDQLQKMIDWDKIMKMSRYSGGHDDQMIGLFKGATVIGHWNEGDYQGTVATCVLLSDGKYAIYNDYSISRSKQLDHVQDAILGKMQMMKMLDQCVLIYQTLPMFLKT